MHHESTFAASIRSGGNSVFVLPLGPVRAPEVKFPVVPDRLLDSIVDDALTVGTARLNGYFQQAGFGLETCTWQKCARPLPALVTNRNVSVRRTGH